MMLKAPQTPFSGSGAFGWWVHPLIAKITAQSSINFGIGHLSDIGLDLLGAGNEFLCPLQFLCNLLSRPLVHQPLRFQIPDQRSDDLKAEEDDFDVGHFLVWSIALTALATVVVMP